jgi:hypothetical protein
LNEVLQLLGSAENGLLDFMNSNLAVVAPLLATIAKQHPDASMHRLAVETLINFV